MTTSQEANTMKQLIIQTAAGKQVMLLQGKHQIQAIKGARYRVLDKKGEKEALADDVIATREGQHLHLRYADGADVVIEDYYNDGSQASVTLPGKDGEHTLTASSAGSALPATGGETQQMLYAHGHSDSLLQMAHSESGMTDVLTQQIKAGHRDVGVWLPQDSHMAAMPLGGLALGGVALVGGGASAPAATLVSKVIASVVGGPVVAGNDLMATIYAADGSIELGSGTINADGTVTVQINTGYTGVVIVRVQNNGGATDADGTPDYMDEATGAGKDLGSAVLYSTGTLTQAGSTTYLNVNVLTSLAYHKAVQAAGSAPLTATIVTNTNTAIAHAFGLDDLTGGTIQTVVDTAGGIQTSNTYGELLAALSGADQNQAMAGDTQATINSLVASITVSGSTATLDADALETVVTGAALTDPGNSLNLVDSVSNATTVVSASVSINEVAVDNNINASEQGAALLTGTNVAGATVTLTIGGHTRNATVSGTTWTYTLTADDIAAIDQGAERLVATASLGAITAQATRGIYVDTIAPVMVITSAALSNDATPTVSGTAEVGNTVTVSIAGATYTVKADSHGHWSLDTGAVTPTTGTLSLNTNGNNAVTVTATDPAGNPSSPATQTLVLDTTVPTITITSPALSNDSTPTISGTTEANAVVTVTIGGAAYTVTANGSGVWSLDTGTVTPTTGTLSLNTNGNNAVTVTTTDPAGNTGSEASQTLVLDSTAPTTTVTIDSISADSGAADFTTNDNDGLTVNATISTALVSGETLEYSHDNGSSWSVVAAGDISGTAVSFADSGLTSTNTLKFRVVDTAGNAGTVASQLVTIDTTAPTIELSAITGGTGGFVINGSSANDRSGYSVSSAGDVNGDGLSDLIVGAPSAAPGGVSSAGKSYVVFGQTGTVAVDLSAVEAGTGGFVINGRNSSDTSGVSVSSAGDVNGDGLSDLIVGAEGASTAAGKSYVVFGQTNTMAVDLSTIEAGTGGFVMHGELRRDRSGISVSSSGDVNGDGLSDLLVGAYRADPMTGGADAGTSYVVFGRTSGGAIDLATIQAGVGGFAINGESGSDNSGRSVSSAGDVNGDGLSDLIVGAPAADPAGGANAGKSYVVFGQTGTATVDLSAVEAGTGGFVINGQTEDDNSGRSVSSAGDVNGDGLADLIVGAFTADPTGGSDAGKSYVVFGQTGTNAINLSDVEAGTGGFVINGQAASDNCGISVSSAGDMNGDGLGDLIVRAAYLDPNSSVGAGKSYVVFGKTGSTAVELSAIAAGTGGFAINGGVSDDACGISNSSAGDVNGDGLSDLIVGAHFADPAGGADAGKSYVIFGATTGAFAQTAVDWMGSIGNDTQSDGGTAKTLVGGAGNDSLTATAASVLYGGSGADTFGIGSAMIAALQAPMGSGGNTTQLARIDGGSGIDTIALSDTGLTLDLTQVANQAASNPDGGSRIDSVEKIDLTGTGNNTLKLTAKDVLDMAGFNSFATTGRHQIMVTGNSGDTLDLADDGNATTGWTLASSNATIGSTSYAVWNHTTLATVYVDTGVTVQLNDVPPPPPVDLLAIAGGMGGFVINGQGMLQDFSGCSVSSAGDVNGDGLSDLIVGAINADPAGGEDAGKSYVVFGRTGTAAVDLSAVEAGTGGFVINGQAASDQSGWSVSSAGDMNGDGLSDLIVGAAFADPAGGNNAGKSYVVFGQTGSTAIDLSAVEAGTGGFVINGQSSYDNSGYSVSSAGDVNNDGLSDLIVGAAYADPAGGSGAGKSYVVFGQTGTTAVDLSAVEVGTGGFVINGQTEDDNSGYSVSSTGDLNGDGLSDLIVGAYQANGYAGKSYVVFGQTGSAAIDLSAVETGVGGFVINGQTEYDKSGISVSSAGDVNGDGLSDLIVGASWATPADRSLAGKSYVIFGATTGSFSQTAVDWMGSTGNDTQSDGGTAKTLVGGAGNDSLTATAASVLYGGSGADTFNIDSTMIAALQSPMGSGGNTTQLARIDGGSGIDTIALSGTGLTFDFTLVANQAASNPDGGSRIDSVEKIDLTGTGNNTLKLTAKDVLDMAGFNSFETTGRHQIMVTGNSGDTLDLVDSTGTSGWTHATANATIGSTTYAVWNNNASLATVYVDLNLTNVI